MYIKMRSPTEAVRPPAAYKAEAEAVPEFQHAPAKPTCRERLTDMRIHLSRSFLPIMFSDDNPASNAGQTIFIAVVEIVYRHYSAISV